MKEINEESESNKETNEKEEQNNNSNNSKKGKNNYDKMIEEIKTENSKCYISVISEPLLKKKYYKYFLKILDYTYCAKVNISHIIKTNENLDEQRKKILKTKFLVIGLSQVIKAIRKGIQGIVIIAVDIYPIDIICHIPVFCEEHNIPYTFVTTKNKLAHLCKLKRSITCLFIINPNKDHISIFEDTINQYNKKQKINNYSKLYEKLLAAVKKNHPFFQS
ncbi:60S ribosomal protein L7ae/L30e, putative [Plasmodium malariae]|uniref:60S ribosomal protein L7ae/L30e, putative n=1 Tax=Plasmodium malariae TaxID=5858 RepID=A0A1C3KM24_PLAMA|nr:60S ribosomal protein L7ae/L30e, putative [Plasmodium malariae]